MKTILCLLLTVLPALSRVLEITASPLLSPAQVTVVQRVRDFFNTWVTDRGLPVNYSVLTVDLRVVPIDGTWEVLAQTTASEWWQNTAGKFVCAGSPRIDLDSADVPLWSDRTLADILFHELGHVFGWHSTIWHYNGVCRGSWTSGQFISGGYYTGPAAAVFAAEYCPGMFIPMDESHLTESITPNDIMSPELNGDWVSRTFLAVLADNGCTVRPGFIPGNVMTVIPRRPITPPVIP